MGIQLIPAPPHSGKCSAADVFLPSVPSVAIPPSLFTKTSWGYLRAYPGGILEPIGNFYFLGRTVKLQGMATLPAPPASDLGEKFGHLLSLGP